MGTITFRVTKEEKNFIQAMADLNGLTLSELSRSKLLEALEDEIDLEIYHRAMEEHRNKDESISHDEMMKELDL